MCSERYKIAILISFTCISLTFLGSAVFALENVTNGTPTVTTKINTMNWKNYSDPLYGLKIKYPADWEPGIDRYESLFFKPLDDTETYFRIYSIDLEENETIQKILRDNIFSLKSSDLIENVITTDPNMTKLANGVEIYQYQSAFEYATGNPAKGLTAIAIDGGLKYFLHYEDYSDVFDRYVPIVKTMINSFEPITFEFPESAP